MGYMFCMGPCCGCGKVFSFNPHDVPSAIVNGEREPICEPCVIAANPIRIANGLEPIRIRPGAYEPIDEHEL